MNLKDNREPWAKGITVLPALDDCICEYYDNGGHPRKLTELEFKATDATDEIIERMMKQ